MRTIQSIRDELVARYPQCSVNFSSEAWHHNHGAMCEKKTSFGGSIHTVSNSMIAHCPGQPTIEAALTILTSQADNALGITNDTDGIPAIEESKVSA